MAINDAIFDSITNSEDKMIERFKIPESQACMYLRAYMMMRLFFFREFVISDSSINLNRALRTLILRDEGKNKYDLRKLPPADFGELIKDGTIKLAARDVYKGSFSESLRNAQNNKKLVDKPSAKYTRLIDEICREENIYWWNEARVSQMFTTKIRENMKQQFSDEVNFFLRDLSNRLSDYEILDYNIVKNEALKTHDKTSEEYRILYDMLRDAYDYNIPEYFEIEYLKRFNGFQQRVEKHNFEISPPEEYDISWKYSFNAYAFALVPIEYLKIAWGSGPYNCYHTAMLQYMEGAISFSRFLAALQDYLDYIDRLLVPFYNNRYESKTYKDTILRFKEHKNGADLIALSVETGVWVYGVVEAVSDIATDPASGILKLVLANILPSIIKKGYERYTTLPPIKQAIIRLDK